MLNHIKRKETRLQESMEETDTIDFEEFDKPLTVSDEQRDSAIAIMTSQCLKFKSKRTLSEANKKALQEGRRRWQASLTPEQKVERERKIKATKAANEAALSEQERRDRSIARSVATKEWWETYPEEKKVGWGSKGREAMWSRSEAEKAETSRKKSETSAETWAAKSEEEKAAFAVAVGQGVRNKYQSLTPEEREANTKQKWDTRMSNAVLEGISKDQREWIESLDRQPRLHLPTALVRLGEDPTR